MTWLALAAKCGLGLVAAAIVWSAAEWDDDGPDGW